MPRYALLLCGQARYRKEALESILRNIIQVNNCDVFGHFWINDSDTRLPWDAIAQIANIRDENTYQNEENYIKEIANKIPFTKLEIQKQIMFPVDKFHPGKEKEKVIQDIGLERANHHFRRSNFILQSQWYSVYKANELKTAFEKENNFTYDGVMRFRPDINVPRPIHLHQYSENYLYAPVYSNSHDISDTLAFGPSKIMDLYCNFYHKQEEICQDPRIDALLGSIVLGLYVEKYVGRCIQCSFNFDRNPVHNIQIMPSS